MKHLLAIVKHPIRHLEEWLLGPLRPSIEDLNQLAEGGGEQRHERLHEQLDWRVQRATVVAKGTIGTAASFGIALFVSIFKSELDVPPGILIAAITVSLFSASFGVYTLRRITVLNNNYGALVALVRRL
jgi:hypothetical protein